MRDLTRTLSSLVNIPAMEACGLALPLTLDKTTSGAFLVVRDLAAMQQLCIFHQSRLFAKASIEILP